MNKFATNYLESLVDSVKKYRPGNLSDVLYKGVPAAALISGLAGATHGALSDPGYDEMGHRKSRLTKAIKEALLAGGIGGLAAASTPVIGSGLLDARKAIVNAHNNNFNTGFTRLINAKKNNFEDAVLRAASPNITLEMLAKYITNNAG